LGMTNVPPYWRVLAQPVPPEQGLPHLRNVQISDLRAMDAREAFSVRAYANAPVRNLTFTNVEIHAQRAGTIQNAENWKFADTRIATADGSRVALKDSRAVAGLPEN
jgi:hypothetical protein